ncbi:MAG: phosphatase PAP2 family protein [Bacteroidetes bacterium]|nr:MAG: phosphatase PAP2 family protein [Bacteroidota bacterium]
MKKLFSANPVFWVFFAIFAIFGGILLIYLPKGDEILYLNGLHSNFSDLFFKYATHLGDGFFIVLLIIYLLFVRFVQAFQMAITFALTGIFTFVGKFLLFPNEVRPLAFFQKNTLNLVEGVDVHSFNSFPSGHSMTAFAGFCLLALFSKNNKKGLIAFYCALMVVLSRMYLSQHFLRDTYAGAWLGVLAASMVFVGFDYLPKRNWFERKISFSKKNIKQ